MAPRSLQEAKFVVGGFKKLFKNKLKKDRKSDAMHHDCGSNTYVLSMRSESNLLWLTQGREGREEQQCSIYKNIYINLSKKTDKSEPEITNQICHMSVTVVGGF